MADGSIHARCRSCGCEADIPVYNIVNVQKDPELKEKLLEGKLFIWNCPGCGADNLVKYPLLYHDQAQKLLLWLSDGNKEVEAKMAETIASQEGLSDYTARIVDNPGEMLEKIKIFDAGLDDIPMEICKYVTRKELGRDNVELKFFRLDGADNKIQMTYPGDGQMQVLCSGFSVYEDAAGIARRNPQFTAKGLTRVDRHWLAQYLSD